MHCALASNAWPLMTLVSCRRTRPLCTGPINDTRIHTLPAQMPTRVSSYAEAPLPTSASCVPMSLSFTCRRWWRVKRRGCGCLLPWGDHCPREQPRGTDPEEGRASAPLRMCTATDIHSRKGASGRIEGLCMRHDAWSSLAQANVPHLLQRMVPLRLEQGSRSRAELCGSLCSEVERCVGEVDELRRASASQSHPG